MSWSHYTESETVTDPEVVSDEILFRCKVLELLSSAVTQLKLLNVRIEEMGQTGINEGDL